MKYIYLLTLCLSSVVFGQSKKPENGIPLNEQNSFVLNHVDIQVAPGKVIENGSITVRNGKIVAVDKLLIAPPKDLPVIDGKNGYVVASFIETNASLGLQNQKNTQERNEFVYWNDAIAAEYTPNAQIKLTEKEIQEFHQMGFNLVITHMQDRVAQGYGTLVHLGKSKTPLQQSNVTGHYAFHTGTATNDYPSSLTGMIALLRQTFYDAQWQQLYGKKVNFSLDAIAAQMKKPSVFQADSKWDLFRIHALGKEFNYPFAIVGTGNEYQLGLNLDSITNPLIIPLRFPEAFDLKDPYLTREISLDELKHWELAPTNPAYLMHLGKNFMLTSSGLKSPADFWKNIHKALSLGWTIDDAIRSLTVEPAKFLGLESQYGTIEPTKMASFVLYNNNPFLYEAKVMSVFSDGERTFYAEAAQADLRGTYSLNIDGEKFWLELAGSSQAPTGKIKSIETVRDSVTGLSKSDTLVADARIQLVGNDIVIQFIQPKAGVKNHFSLKGEINTRVFIFEGSGTNPKGKWVKWSAIRNKKAEDKETLKPVWTLDTLSIPNLSYPKQAPKATKHKGREKQTEPDVVIIENATIWSNESDGIYQGTVIAENGKIKSIFKSSGSYVHPANARVIDGTGKILTAGIIDEHSHIALSRGVNEGGQAISCEVRMGDVLNPDDVDIFRQLSGGVTAAQLLHGSANPIGGQSALIKLKYKHLPQDLLIKNAPKFVKFALGENVKQSNWGPSQRYPHSRMGVEQLFVWAFSEARKYHEAQEAHKSKKGKDNESPPAVDLEMEALYEIMSGQRFITCHSYVQSEINMLMHVADSFGFKINTFTHILEGYKVADLMKTHGVGASTFSDWWAYKFEVKDAIPQNASLMTAMGVVVAINSDDAEMGRRLNQEAAKAVKYGGMTEEEAWKLVTLNPAKLLHLDDRMGSVKIGKDADLVLWTTNPLSIEAKVLYTLVDGVILYDAQEAFLANDSIQAEKARIIAKMGDDAKRGETTRPVQRRKKGHYHCNTVGEMESLEANEH